MNRSPKGRWIRIPFVLGGRANAHSAAERKIRAQVDAEYSQRLEAAGPWDRIQIRRTIERRIKIRLDKLAPPDALY